MAAVVLLMLQTKLHEKRHVYLSCSCQSLTETLKNPPTYLIFYK